MSADIVKDICYKRNFLKQVVARIDLAVPIENTGTKLKPSFIRGVLKDFPIDEPREIIGHELQLSAKETTAKKHLSKDWVFYSKNRDKRLCIRENFAYIEIKDFKYDKYENFFSSFKLLLDTLYGNYDIVVNRFGLRYVNEMSVDKPKENRFEWGDYINNKYLTMFDVPKNKTDISRAIQLLEMNYGETKFRFQCGMPNPDYPAKIVKKMFLLDYDCYITGLLEKDAIEKCFYDFHSIIQKYFEESIKDKMRDILSGKK
jgi:uncharacterized protein (TIGR04255 family)